MPKSPAQVAARRAKRRANRAVKQAVKDVAVADAQGLAQQIRGAGDYRPTRVGNALRRAMVARAPALAGRGDYFLGNALGALGKTAGNALQKSIGGIFGFGDYRRRHAAVERLADDWLRSDKFDVYLKAMSGNDGLALSDGGVSFGQGAPRVRHREFIGDVLSSQKFRTDTYRIQPGLRGAGAIMPWGSSVAACFQQYEMRGGVFYFESTASMLSTATNLGSVMMSTLYDANANPLGDEMEVMNNDYTTTRKVSENCIHGLECATKDNPIVLRYVRSGNDIAPGAVSDNRFDDVGIFQISVIGCPTDGDVIGKLWFTYEVDYKKPVLPDVHAGTTALWTATYTGTSGAAPSLSQSQVVVNSRNSIPATVTVTSGGTLELSMPQHYNGSYDLGIFVVAKTADNDLNAVTNIGIQFTPGASADLSYLDIFRDINGGVKHDAGAQSISSGFAFANNDVMFSTVAEDAGQSKFSITLPYATSAGAGMVTYALNILVTALDNDITSPENLSGRELALQATIRRADELLADLERKHAASEANAHWVDSPVYVGPASASVQPSRCIMTRAAAAA